MWFEERDVLRHEEGHLYAGDGREEVGLKHYTKESYGKSWHQPSRLVEHVVQSAGREGGACDST